MPVKSYQQLYFKLVYCSVGEDKSSLGFNTEFAVEAVIICFDFSECIR